MPDDSCLISDLPYVELSQGVYKDVYGLLVGIKMDTAPKPLRLAITDFTMNEKIGLYNAMDLPGGHLDALQVFQVDAYVNRFQVFFQMYRNVFREELLEHGSTSEDMIPLFHQLCLVKVRVQLKKYDDILEGRLVNIALADGNLRHQNWSRILVQLNQLYPQLIHENQTRFDMVNRLLGNPVSKTTETSSSESVVNRTEQPAQSQIKLEAAAEAESLQFPDRQPTPPLHSTGSSQDPSDSDNDDNDEIHHISFDNAQQAYNTAQSNISTNSSVVETEVPASNHRAIVEDVVPSWTVSRLLSAKEEDVAGRTITVNAFVVATIPDDWTLVCGKQYFQSRGNSVELGDPFYRSLEIIISDHRPHSQVLDPETALSVRLQDDDLESFFNNASVEYNYTHMGGQAATLKYPDEPLQLHLYRKDVKISYNMSMPMWSARGLYMNDLVG
ncbi:predicted protein [Meyerozyma guilliermondii ATCC 6260]|uniref:Uncharacterized protein n=1 Tax=Meyerozyma guilliermondii (strain ATCC 6260 / CBS 566 / DSM 6381 / JCM 1539 / NBRC 10279 / NRRL Y-324) TaxID=294746 RepID=A5DAF1_PICGU|nr:uncharacterized protein PGUG_00256 [Meyerozyma guilliermondii ATCC 6260]EDK36158.2 predicted protein [Meyerozyma guilliermondii ATCC 6260]